MATTTPRRRQLNPVERRLEDFVTSKPGSWFYINVAMRIDRVLLPLSGGRFEHQLRPAGRPARDRRSQEWPGAQDASLLFVRDEDHVVLIASMGGAAAAPGLATQPARQTRARASWARAGRPATYVAREAQWRRSAAGSGTRPSTTTPATHLPGPGPASARSRSWCSSGSSGQAPTRSAATSRAARSGGCRRGGVEPLVRRVDAHAGLELDAAPSVRDLQRLRALLERREVEALLARQARATPPTRRPGTGAAGSPMPTRFERWMRS